MEATAGKLPVTIDGIAYITVSVANMQTALDFWVARMGFEISVRKRGADAGLAALWQIAADDIEEQVLLTSPGAAAGRIHLLKFSRPGEAVRFQAAATDLGPKNLDIACTDMHRHVAELQSAGYMFRSAVGEYTLGELQAREVQMPCHDDTNIVFIEELSNASAFQVGFSNQGFAGVTSFVVVVPDTVKEALFYQRLLGLDEVLYHRVSGPEIEAVVGLPPGAALELRILGRATEPFGRMELVSYGQIAGLDRFARTEPFATGVLSCGFVVSSMDAMLDQLSEHALPIGASMQFDTLLGAGRVSRTISPAGLKLDLIQLD
jgi:catechol 2,3-dioxygenase-like lactoylglutathione lyase family enzyme